MKKINTLTMMILLTYSFSIAQELEVEGDLKVTGTVESTTIDSLNQVIANTQDQINAMQAQIEVLANSALNAGFVETEVFSETTVEDAWTDLDLSSAVGQKTSLVLLRFVTTNAPGTYMWIRPNGDSNEYHSPGEGTYGGSNIVFYSGNGQNSVLAMVTTDSNGIIEYQMTSEITLTVSVLFYLNQ